MKRRCSIFAAGFASLAAASLVLGGCGSIQSRAQDAFNEYQAAIAAGDTASARIALLRLVAVDDRVASYWIELGKVQLELGEYSDAYYAFTRAHELDRSDVAVLGTLTQLALLSGNTDAAEEKARQLELIAPSHPAVKLTDGFVALRRGNLDEADKQADQLLVTSPFDTSAKLLKAKVLLTRNRHGDAVALLTQQVRVRPTDVASLKSLAALHERHNNWAEVEEVARQMVRVNPRNREASLLLIEAAFRSNDVPSARAASLAVLGPEAPGDLVDAVLTLWSEHWPGPDSIGEARRQASAAKPHQRIAYATFFNRARSPADAVEMVGNAPRLPVTVSNTSVNAILAESLALSGRVAEAKRLLDAVLAIEPDHVYALRARTELYLTIGASNAAIRDAQRLVSILPNSAAHRLLLARAFASRGDRRHLERTLWDAFHQVPANWKVYQALHNHIGKSEDVEAARRVTDEFEHQRDVAMNRKFI